MSKGMNGRLFVAWTLRSARGQGKARVRKRQEAWNEPPSPDLTNKVSTAVTDVVFDLSAKILEAVL